jgi:UDP-2,3-diacylglucosamine hydrolase
VWSVANVPPKLGIIAGNGSFPLELAAAARAHDIEVVAVAHHGETDPRLAGLCPAVTWIQVGQLERIIAAFKDAGVQEAAMAGGIARVRLGQSFMPDARAMAMLARLGRFSDDAVLRGVAAELEADGIAVIDPVYLLGPALAVAGTMAGPEPSAAQLRDLELGFAVADAVGRYDIGQAVAVLGGVVAAVEAVEGTDAAIDRAAALCGRGLVVVKAAKPGQDLRFDRPAIGPATIVRLHQVGAAVLGIQAGVTMLLEREQVLESARNLGITVYGYAGT